ncbi:Hsp33 family molecular chaperone HslO [Lactobacillus sp. UCMA15818]|uniref:Hsp33 family molecular chaperone HslO n=1 Tax=Lactobacillaceae TaxID=33958 RepID=UPI0025AF5D33|nr:Hsp33 family molecular chaperone HslO [Lactobacillus sp. UCMA15818]MDN2453867.1 Hsp33 family molecular chaperone HslO [Lactobacillus sp. UCMA15818]
MTDYLIKALAYNGQLRVYAIDTTETVRKAQRIHDTWSAATAAFGRAITATSLLSQSLLKGGNKMTVKIMGNGPTGTIVIDGTASGDVKGYLKEPHVHLPLNKQQKIDVKGAVGSSGLLEITKDLGLKMPFTGQVPLVSGELGEDFTYYMAKSEQIPSSIGVSVFVNNDNSVRTAGGFMVQAMPDADEAVLAEVEQNIANLPAISVMMAKKTIPEEIIYRICGQKNTQILDKVEISYRCDCSKERFAKSLASISPADLKLIIEEDHGAEVICHFCKKKYVFTEAELERLVKDI